MELQDLIKELRQLNKVAQSELADMKRRERMAERYEDYERGWADGFEEATEIFENTVDDLTRLLKQFDIEETMKRSVPVSEKQKPLI
jgi:flagellar biosynthesis/type III secretory pathway protein FliH